jgi:transposase
VSSQQVQEVLMASDDLRELLRVVGRWDGFEIVQWTTDETLAPDALGLPAPRITIELRPAAGAAKRCSRCGTPVEAVHDVTERRVRDLPLMAYDVWLVFPQARLRCPRCGPSAEDIPWLDRYQRMTKRLAETLARLAQVLPLTRVAELYHVSWDTVKQIDKRALAARLGPLEASDLSGVRRIAIDEFALRRGQRYATLVVDVDTKRVIWVHRGRDAEALSAFFAALGVEGRARIQAVVIDLARPYVKAVRTHCPQAAIVYDLFHALAWYTADVLDRVRMDEANRITLPSRHRHRRRAEHRRRFLTGKGVRWLLLRDRGTLRSPAERVRLDELLAANRSLFIVYVLKEDLRSLWRLRDPAAARHDWQSWYARACESGIPALVRFANRLVLIAQYIINHALHPLHTSLLEGMNNKIKVMKRMAYGYRDEDYFFLKIRAAFPGIS